MGDIIHVYGAERFGVNDRKRGEKINQVSLDSKEKWRSWLRKGNSQETCGKRSVRKRWRESMFHKRTSEVDEG